VTNTAFTGRDGNIYLRNSEGTHQAGSIARESLQGPTKPPALTVVTSPASRFDISGLDADEIGECDNCTAQYPTWSKEGRCGGCGNCDTCCPHANEHGAPKQTIITLPVREGHGADDTTREIFDNTFTNWYTENIDPEWDHVEWVDERYGKETKTVTLEEVLDGGWKHGRLDYATHIITTRNRISLILEDGEELTLHRMDNPSFEMQACDECGEDFEYELGATNWEPSDTCYECAYNHPDNQG
jgi:hypothetical protein